MNAEVIMYIDVETTGLVANKNDIIDLAILVEVKGEIVHREKMSCRPWNPEHVHPKALEVNGRTMEQIMSFPHPEETLNRFKEILNTYKKDGEKFIFAGYNCQFDARFVDAWMKKAGDTSFEYYFDYHVYDCYSLFKAFATQRGIEIANKKLITVAEFFDIELEAHEAMSDIVATHKIFKLLENYFKPAEEVVETAGEVIGLEI